MGRDHLRKAAVNKPWACSYFRLCTPGAFSGLGSSSVWQGGSVPGSLSLVRAPYFPAVWKGIWLGNVCSPAAKCSTQRFLLGCQQCQDTVPCLALIFERTQVNTTVRAHLLQGRGSGIPEEHNSSLFYWLLQLPGSPEGKGVLGVGCRAAVPQGVSWTLFLCWTLSAHNKGWSIHCSLIKSAHKKWLTEISIKNMLVRRRKIFDFFFLTVALSPWKPPIYMTWGQFSPWTTLRFQSKAICVCYLTKISDLLRGTWQSWLEFAIQRTNY